MKPRRSISRCRGFVSFSTAVGSPPSLPSGPAASTIAERARAPDGARRWTSVNGLGSVRSPRAAEASVSVVDSSAPARSTRTLISANAKIEQLKLRPSTQPCCSMAITLRASLGCTALLLALAAARPVPPAPEARGSAHALTLRGGLGPRRAQPPPSPAELPASAGGVGGFVQRSVVQPLTTLMQRGITPRTLAASLALGGACGVFPVPLTTWAVTLLANAIFPALNPLAMQIANSIVTPLMVPLFPVFLKVSTKLRGPMRADFSFADIRAQFAAVGFAGALSGLKEPLGRAVLGWAVMLPLLYAVLYAISLAPAHALARKYAPTVGLGAAGAEPAPLAYSRLIDQTR